MASAPKKTVKKAATVKTTETAKKNSAVGFVNWSIPMEGGANYNSSKGFPIFQNPEYPNPQEDTLVELARQHGGIVELTMKVRVVLVDRPARKEPELAAFILG